MAASDLPTRLRGASVRGLLSLPRPALRAIAGRTVVVDGQRLDLEAQVGLRLLELAGEDPLDKLTPERARARIREDAAAFAGRKVDVASAQEIAVDGAAGRLGGRLYVPHAEAGEPGALLVYFHGGGFVTGDLDTHDNVCRFVAHHAGVRVLAIDYRRAPEHRFPAAFDDAVAAFRFAVEHAGELGADRERIAVAGDSAGGNLAAGVALAARGDGDSGPALQVLFYPWLDLSTKRRSYTLFAEGFYLTEADLDWYKSHYLADDQQAVDPRCSPALTQDLTGVAPAYVVTAGFDPLRDEGEEYAARLREAGAWVTLHRHSGMIHGFVNTAQIGRSAREALLEASGVLRFALARGGGVGGRLNVSGRTQIHLSPPGGIKEVGAQFLDRSAANVPLPGRRET